MIVSCPHCQARLEAEADWIGSEVQCPQCNKSFVIQGGEDAAGEPAAPVEQEIAPPPESAVDLPKRISKDFKTSHLPPVFVELSASGTDVKADFGVALVPQQLVDSIAGRMKKKYHVQIGTQGSGYPLIQIEITRIDAGNRFMRYFLTFLAGRTRLEITGRLHTAEDVQHEFKFASSCYIGVFGGDSLSLLKQDATVLGTKVAKFALKLLE